MLEQVFSQKSVIINLESTEKDELFEEMLESIVATQGTIDRTQALTALREREAKMSTGIIHLVAVPHASVDSVEGIVGAIGISSNGIEYDSLDSEKVHLVFMLLCNPDAVDMHLKVMRELSLLLKAPSFIEEMLKAKSQQEIYDTLCKFEKSINL